MLGGSATCRASLARADSLSAMVGKKSRTRPSCEHEIGSAVWASVLTTSERSCGPPHRRNLSMTSPKALSARRGPCGGLHMTFAASWCCCWCCCWCCSCLRVLTSDPSAFVASPSRLSSSSSRESSAETASVIRACTRGKCGRQFLTRTPKNKHHHKWACLGKHQAQRSRYVLAACCACDGPV